MYGNVCVTGGTREVLPPPPRNVSRWRICFNLKFDFASRLIQIEPRFTTYSLWLHPMTATTKIIRATRHNTVLWAGATIRRRPTTHIIHSNKVWAYRSVGQLIVSVSCLRSAVLGAPPLLFAHFAFRTLYVFVVENVGQKYVRVCVCCIYVCVYYVYVCVYLCVCMRVYARGMPHRPP